MSSTTQPIDPARFAEALTSLPLETLHEKAAEIRNSIAHLKSSNEQMLPFAEEGDDDCREAMFENLSVIGRMNERVALIRTEVENRGARWAESEVEDAKMQNGHAEGDGVNGANRTAHAAPSGRLTDDELRRRLAEQMGDDEEEEGVHL